MVNCLHGKIGMFIHNNRWRSYKYSSKTLETIFDISDTSLIKNENLLDNKYLDPQMTIRLNFHFNGFRFYVLMVKTWNVSKLMYQPWCNGWCWRFIFWIAKFHPICKNNTKLNSNGKISQTTEKYEKPHFIFS